MIADIYIFMSDPFSAQKENKPFSLWSEYFSFLQESFIDFKWVHINVKKSSRNVF